MKKLIFILFAFTSYLCFSQNNTIDSLLHLLKTSKDAVKKVNQFNILCREYILIGVYDSALYYANEAITVANSLLPRDGRKAKATSYNLTGAIYYNLGNYPEALKNYFASLKLKEEIGEKTGIASAYNNIGAVYEKQGNLQWAVKQYFIALKIYETINDKQGIASEYNNLGIIYMNKGDYPKALKSNFASLKMREEVGDKIGIASSYNNIAVIHSNQGNFPGALKNHLIALKIRKEIKDKNGIATSYLNLGFVNAQVHKFTEAQEYLNKALQLGMETGSKDVIKDSYLFMTTLDSSIGNYKSAFEHHKLFFRYRDSIDNEETERKTIQSAMTYEFEKKEAAIKLEQEKKEVVAKAESKKQRIILWSVSGILTLVIAFAIFAYRNFLQKQKAHIEITKQKNLIEEKQKEILDSIRYAKRIQTALLTSEKYMDRNLKRLSND
jgi:tetratricopeptide (TPR) repeat protein